jgi:hypothetical protein
LKLNPLLWFRKKTQVAKIWSSEYCHLPQLLSVLRRIHTQGHT